MENEKKIKILTLSDHPLYPTGVAHQTKLFIESLLETGKFCFISFGGALKHQSMQPTKTEKWGDDWTIYPVIEFGNPELVRSILRTEKPDILWFMTDPRFFGWLWQMEDEIRPLIPMVYYHVWDNKPTPTFNETIYKSTDVIATISKLTDDIVKEVSPNVERVYLPHAVDTNIFKPLSKEEFENQRLRIFGASHNKFVWFWNNRNARRKNSGDLLFWYKDFLDETGHDKSVLFMHTNPFDVEGPNLISIMEHLGLTKGQVVISMEPYPIEYIATLNGVCDCVINISEAEGFGLNVCEGMACGKPIIANMTGGLQDQVFDGEKYYGVGIKPVSKNIIGSQQIPWIYEDRISREDFVDAMKKIFYMPKDERLALGESARESILKRFDITQYKKSWVDLMLYVHEKYGSWDTRKLYIPYELIEL